MVEVTPIWVTPLIKSLLKLAAATLPSTDSILDLDVGSLLKADYIAQHAEWSKNVYQSLCDMRALCNDITAACRRDEQEEEFQKVLLVAAQHAKHLTAMRTRFEWLAAMSDLMQRHKGFFNHGGELYAPHETLRTGITPAGIRRFAVSYCSFMSLLGELLDERLDDTTRADSVLATHEWMTKNSWQVRLNDDKPEFVAVNSPEFFGSRTKVKPEYWRLVMLELNSDMLDASKKVVFGNLTAGQATEEAVNMWKEVLTDLSMLMELRSRLLAGQPISRRRDLVDRAQLPAGLVDERGVPPVVMWCSQWVAKQAQPPDRKKSRQEPAGSWDSSWSWSTTWSWASR